jgi:hypothetical protein
LSILAKEYVGNLNANFSDYNYKYAYIYGATVIFSRGASPSYTLTTTAQRTCGISFNIASSLTVDAVEIKSTISSSYTKTATITLSKGETWSCGFTEPGTYNLTWYMRGHNYKMYADVRWICTDSSDGTIHYEYIGSFTKPTTEITFSVMKVS